MVVVRFMFNFGLCSCILQSFSEAQCSHLPDNNDIVDKISFSFDLTSARHISFALTISSHTSLAWSTGAASLTASSAMSSGILIMICVC